VRFRACILKATSQAANGQGDDLSEIVVGKKYGWRLKPSVPGPLGEIRVLEKVGRKGMIKIRHLGPPHAGLEEFVKTGSIIVPWNEQKAFLRDKERLRQAREASAKEGDRARQEATSTILESSGENQAAVYRADGMLDVPIEVAQRLADRAGLTEPIESLHALSFIDRHRILHLPYLGAERLARAFAAAEPELVLREIENHELRLKSEGYEPGNRYLHELLRDYQPSFALARQWTGFDKEVEQLRKEVERLRVLVRRAVGELKTLGPSRKRLGSNAPSTAADPAY
jgi:hypothetical protein